MADNWPLTTFLAQGGADEATNAALGTESTSADGTGATPAARQPGPFGNTFWMILLMVVAFLFFQSMMMGRKEKKKKAEMMNTLAKYDKIQTIGGILGTVIEVKKDSVVVKTDESTNTRITVARSAIQQVTSKVGRGKDGDSKEETSDKEAEAAA